MTPCAARVSAMEWIEAPGGIVTPLSGRVGRRAAGGDSQRQGEAKPAESDCHARAFRRVSRKCCSRMVAARASTSSLRPARRAALLGDGRVGSRGGHPLVHQRDRQVGPATEQDGQLPRRGGGRAFVAVGGQGKSYHQTDRAVTGDQLEKRRHREALAPAAGERGERRGDGLGLVREGEADPHLAPVHGKDAAGGGDGHGLTDSSWRRTPCWSWCASSARAGTPAPRPAACRPGSSAAGRPG